MADQITAWPTEEEERPQRSAPPISAFPPDEDPLRQRLDQAQQTPPDRAARVFQMRLKTGLPGDVIERNLDEVERDVTSSTFNPEQFKQRHPELADWLVQAPEHAPAVRDEVDEVAKLLDVLRVAGNGVRAIGAGLYSGIAQPYWSGVRLLGDFTGLDELARGAAEQGAIATATADAIRGDRTNSNAIEQGVNSGLESLGSNLPGLIAAALSGGAPAAAARVSLGTMGTQVTLQSYGEARDAKVDPSASLLYGLNQGGIEVLTEQIPAVWFFKDIARGTPLWKLLVKQMGAELPGEQVATLLQDLNEWAVLHPDQPFSSYTDARVDAAVQTAIATIVQVGVQGTAFHTLERLTNKPASQQVLEDLHAAAAATKSQQRAPEVLKAVVDHANKNGVESIGVPVDPFNEFFQKEGINPQAHALELGVTPEQYAEALQTGGDLAIPTGTYLAKVVGSGHEAFFASEARLHPDLPNAREYKEAQSPEGKATLEAIERELTQDVASAGDVDTTPSVAIAQMVYRAAREGGVSEREARSVAAFYGYREEQRALARGVDPVAFYQSHPYQVVVTDESGRPVMTRPTPPTQVDGTVVDIPASAAAAGETREARQARETAHVAALERVVVEAAQKIDPTVDVEQLRRELAFRLEVHQDGLREHLASGQDPVALLRAIASYGGLQSGQGAEVDDMGEGTRFGAVNGVPGVRRADGLAPDLMLQHLQQDGQFAHLADENALLDAVNLAARPDTAGGTGRVDALPGTTELRDELDIDLATAWWADAPWATDPTLQTLDGEHEDDELAPDAPDADDFNVDELEQRAPAKTGLVTVGALRTAPAKWVRGKLRMSTRVPLTADAPLATDVLETRLGVVLADGSTRGDAVERFATAVRKAPLLTEKEKATLSDAEQLQRFVEHAADNLVWLFKHRQVRPWRQRSMQWYLGAHRFAKDLATRGGFALEQTAAAIAVNSPNTFWPINVDSAYRVVDIVQWAQATNARFTPDLAQAYTTWARASQSVDLSIIAGINAQVGKRWRALDIKAKAALVEFYDRASNPREFLNPTPEGKSAGPYRNLDGGESRRRPPTMVQVERAVSVLEDGSPENIHLQLGRGHKVRSFYNNVLDPSWNGPVTMDTHAIAAALFFPVGADHPYAKAVFSGGPGLDHAGINGLSPVYAEAYHLAAQRLGVLPRELQSVTWNAAQGLFSPDQRDATNGTLVAHAEALWRQVSSGTLTAHDVRSQLHAAADGVRPPDWHVAGQGVARHKNFVPPRYAPGPFPRRGVAGQRGLPGTGPHGIAGRVSGDARGSAAGARRAPAAERRRAKLDAVKRKRGSYEQRDETPTPNSELTARRARAQANAESQVPIEDPPGTTPEQAARNAALRAELAREGKGGPTFAQVPAQAQIPHELAGLAGLEPAVRPEPRVYPMPHGVTVEADEENGDYRLSLPNGRGMINLIAPVSYDLLPKDYLYVGDVKVANPRQGEGRRLYEAAVGFALSKGFRGLSSHPDARNEQSDGLWRAMARDGTVSKVGPHDVVTFTGGEYYQLDGFYSRVARAVERAQLAKATGKQWKATIKNAGVNLEEYQALAIDTLDDRTVYSQTDLLAHLTKHQIDVEVVTLSEEPYTAQDVAKRADELYRQALDEKIQELEENIGAHVAFYDVDSDVEFVEDDEEWTAYFRPQDEAIAWAETEDEAREQAAKWIEATNQEAQDEFDYNLRDRAANDLNYGDYEEEAEEELDERTKDQRAKYVGHSEPGADAGSHREVFLTANEGGRRDGFVALTDEENALLQNGLAGAVRRIRQLEQIPAEQAEKIDSLIADFSDGAYLSARRMPEAAAHTRDVLVPILQKLRAAPDRSWGERGWSDGHDDYDQIENPIVRLRFSTHTAVDGTTTMFLDEVQAPLEDEFAKMLPLYQEHWRELAFKWALRYAAVHHVDQVAWTTGAMQVQRYSLRQVADRIAYYPNSQQLAAYKKGRAFTVQEWNGAWRVFDADGDIFTPGGAHRTRARAEFAAASLATTESEVARHHDVAPDQLEKYIGKELAERLLASALVPTPPPVWTIVDLGAGDKPWALYRDGVMYDRLPTEQWARAEKERFERLHVPRGGTYEIAGEGLEVGGVGITRLYESDFPKVVNKLLKKTGSKVEPLQVPFGKIRKPMPASFVGRNINISDAEQAGYLAHRMRDWDAKNPPLDDTKPVPGVRITPAVRAHFSTDQALYHADKGDGSVLRGSYNPTTRTIRLIAGQANLTTMLHESGHVFLEELVEDALAVEDGHRLRADARIALDYLGFHGTLEDFRAGSVDDKRDMHERWADSFLQYLHDGKAPVAELQPLFSRFRSWIFHVLRSAVGLGIELPTDVRGVMDRLFASEQAIAAAEREVGAVPLYSDAASMGVDELTFAAYRDRIVTQHDDAVRAIDARLMADWRREQSALWKDLREGVRREVAKTYNDQAVFVAQSMIRAGTMPDGTPAPFGTGAPMKLSKDAIVAQFGREMLARLPKPFLYTVKGGSDPEVVAQLTGFPSAESMLEALVAAPKLDAVIERDTDARMLDEHGERMLDGLSLQEAARAAVQDQRRNIVAAELRALTQGMAADRIPSAQVLRAQAQAAIANTKVRDLKPGQYRAAIARASKQAFDLLGANDRRGAIEAKKRELLAIEYYRAAREAQEAADKTQRRMQQLDTSPTIRGRMGKAGVQDQIDQILERYEFRRVPNKQLDRRQSLLEYLEQLKADGNDVSHIPAEVIADARRVNWRSLTVAELEAVRDAVEMIAHLGRTKDRLLTIQKNRELEDAANEAVLTIETHAPKDRGELRHETETPAARRETWFAELRHSHRLLANLVYEMDGFQHGPLWNLIVRPLNEASNEKVDRLKETTAWFDALVDQHYPVGTQSTMGIATRYFPELGKPDQPNANLTTVGRLMYALNYGNKDNKQRLRDGFGRTDAQVRAVIDSLDDNDWNFVEAVWQRIDAFWPETVAKEKRRTGIVPQKVEPEAFTTKTGRTIAGGYFPISYNRKLNAKARGQQLGQLHELHQHASGMSVQVKRNHEKARSEADIVGRGLRLDFGVIAEHVEDVIHSLAYHEVLIDLGRVLRRPEVQEAIYTHYGEESYALIANQIEYIAIGEREVLYAVDKLADKARRGGQVVALGGNFITPLVQLTGYATIAARAGHLDTLKATMAVVANPVGAVRRLQRESVFLKNRFTTQSQNLYEMSQRIGQGMNVSERLQDRLWRRTTGLHLSAVQGGYFRAITVMQSVVDAVAYTVARDQALRAGKDPETARALGEQMVRDTQSSGEPAYVAEVMRGNAYKKLFTSFMGPMVALHNVWVDKYRRGQRRRAEGEYVAGAGEAAAAFLTLFVLGPALGTVLRELAKGDLGDDDDGEKLLWEMFNTFTGRFFGIREAAQAVSSGFDYEGPAGLRPVGDLVTAVKRAGSSYAKEDPVTWSAWKAGITAVGALTLLPTNLALRFIDGVVALKDGETTNPVAPIFGFDHNGRSDSDEQ